MSKIQRKSPKHLKNLANIPNLEVFREKLEKTDFSENSSFYYKTIYLDPNQPIHKFSQILPKKTEKIDLNKIQERIKEQNLEGYLISTSILEDVLKKHPLALSAQKQSIIEHICRMNSGPHNQAEGIHLIYAHGQEQTPILNHNIKPLLAPNLSSQIISSIHRNKKSSLTIGEAHSTNQSNQASGEAVLQITHLSHHAMDLDLSQEVQRNTLGKTHKTKDKLSVFETCINLPYSIRDRHFSDHGYVLHLKGDHLTPQKIVDIIGLKENGFGGTIITSGTISSSILNDPQRKKIDLHSNNLKFYTLNKVQELIGAFTYDPHLELTKNGYCNLEKLGHLKSLSGEITLVFFPFFQSFIGEYKS